VSNQTSQFRSEIKLLLQAALLIFIFTVGIGILNGLDIIDFDRKQLMSHVHAGTLGWITLGFVAACLWIFSEGRAAVRAVRSISSGDAIFGATIARRMMNYFSSPRPPAPPQTFPELTEREREILSLMAQHLTNPEIAQRLSISEKTVRNQVSNILNKLQVADRAQAIIRAREAGLS
jgi:DNA-binding CsgD family transcriptional regulator